MSSTLVVPVVEVKDVREHPNADTLELCTVLGYQMVIRKGEYKSGDKAVYFPTDTLLSQELIEAHNLSNFLKGPDKNRVGCIRLRGHNSFGLVLKIPEIIEHNTVGDNVADLLGCQRYQPPVRATCGDAAPFDPEIDVFIHRYTDIENGRIFTDVFSPEDEVVVTEKIHGSNVKLVYIPEKGFFAGSMSVRRKHPRYDDGDLVPLGADRMFSNTYWAPYAICPRIDQMMESISRTTAYIKSYPTLGKEYCDQPVVTVYGEVFGPKVQNLNYGLKDQYGFRVFDITVSGEYMDFDVMSKFCLKFEVPVVPILYRGKFDFDIIDKLSDGPSTLDSSHIREGVVVKTVVEDHDEFIGRKIMKYIGNSYLMGKKDSDDNTDV